MDQVFLRLAEILQLEGFEVRDRPTTSESVICESKDPLGQNCFAVTCFDGVWNLILWSGLTYISGDGTDFDRFVALCIALLKLDHVSISLDPGDFPEFDLREIEDEDEDEV